MRCIHSLAALALAASCGSDPSAPAVAPSSPVSHGRITADDAVTLITGDRVVLGTAGLRVEPGPGRAGIGVVTTRLGDHTLVIPNDVGRQVVSGQLDRSLFDVTQLIADGYGDRRRADLPLIVTGGAAGTGAAIAGVAVDRVLATAGAVAVRWPKSNAGARLATLPADAKVWLDRLYHPTLDRSVPQIGGTAAHARGLTGVGVTVAVIDTGVDASHADLADRVVAAETFVPDERGPEDVLGHGTHVASIIAGTGAASGGLYAGVAPGAQLVSARVCADIGCAESWIIAGLEWAVLEQHARIVNVSLGHVDSIGDDPLEATVNRLSAQTGALIVVSAGNFGEFGNGWVASPATADAALAVGAVDRDDQLAVFSSRGPRTGDLGVKPEITAPGVEIVAARAAGVDPIGEPVGTSYQALSGTSMASPHVAGAAALLLQQHPDWSGPQLKPALIGAANPNPSLDAFEQGGGRVDIDRATRQPISSATSTLGFGTALWPHDDDPVLERTVTYRNTGTAAVQLTLAASIAGPDRTPVTGMASVSPATLDVPAGGTATATVSLATRDHLEGLYSGLVIASGAGDIRVVTPFAVELEGEAHGLHLRMLDRAGAPTTGRVWVLDLTEQQLLFARIDGELTLRLPPHRYALSAIGDQPLAMVYSRLDLDRDTAIDFDGRLARPIAVQIPGVDLVLRSVAAEYRDTPNQLQLGFFGGGDLALAQIGPDAPPDEVQSWLAGSSVAEDDGPVATAYLLAHRERGHLMTGWREVVPRSKLARVDAEHVGHGPSLHRKATAAILADTPNAAAGPGFATYAGSFDRTDYYYGPGFRWGSNVFELARTDVIPDVEIWVNGQQQLRDYQPGGRYRERWNQGPFGPVFPPLDEPATYRDGDRLAVRPSMISDRSSVLHASETAWDHQHLALFRNGVEIANYDDEHTYRLPVQTVSPEPAEYRLEQAIDRRTLNRDTGEPLYDLSNQVSAAWTFKSRHTSTREVLALPVLRYEPFLDDESRTSARVLVLPVRIERPPGAPTPRIASARIDVSFDDGATWTHVPSVLVGDRLFGVIAHPAGTRFVSLRGSAADVAGNRVEQTTIRVYGVR